MSLEAIERAIEMNGRPWNSTSGRSRSAACGPRLATVKRELAALEPVAAIGPRRRSMQSSSAESRTSPTTRTPPTPRAIGPRRQGAVRGARALPGLERVDRCGRALLLQAARLQDEYEVARLYSNAIS